MGLININTGEFYISDNVKIERFKNYDEVLMQFVNIETKDIGNGYKWIYCKNIEIDNLSFNIGICFYCNKLFCIDFGFTFEQQKNVTWDNWNEESEIKRKEIYENWLTKNIGSKRKFSWGTIGAYYDPRSGTSAMNIKYR
jgi:hypothetical protein